MELMIDGRKYITAKQAAKLARVHIQTIYRWAQQGLIESEKIAGVYGLMLRKIDVERLGREPFSSGRPRSHGAKRS